MFWTNLTAQEVEFLIDNGSQTDDEESDTVEGQLRVIKLVAQIEPPVFIYNKLYCACWTLSRIESTISNQVSDYLKVVFSNWKNLCFNMIITNSNPSYLELLGLFTVHTNVSTNARLSLQL